MSVPINYENLELGYKFKDILLLERALTHPSISTTSPSIYERSEFLGDRVLGLVVAHFLYIRYPDDKEGALAKRLSSLVKKETLTQVAEHLDLGAFIKFSKSEEIAGGRKNPSTLADACEALIGAIYLEGGFEAAQNFILKAWNFLLHKEEEALPIDPKTALQELLQKQGYKVPEYRVSKVTGPHHAPFFMVEVRVKGVEKVYGEGSSKRRAEQEAAAKVLAILEDKSKE